MQSLFVVLGLLALMFGVLWFLAAPGMKSRQFIRDSAAEAKHKRAGRFGRNREPVTPLPGVGWKPWAWAAFAAAVIAIYGLAKGFPSPAIVMAP